MLEIRCLFHGVRMFTIKIILYAVVFVISCGSLLSDHFIKNKPLLFLAIFMSIVSSIYLFKSISSDIQNTATAQMQGNEAQIIALEKRVHDLTENQLKEFDSKIYQLSRRFESNGKPISTQTHFGALILNRSFYRAWLEFIEDPNVPVWIKDYHNNRDGTFENQSKVVTIGREKYYFTKICNPENCSTDYLSILTPSDADSVYGNYFYEETETYFGYPSLIQRLKFLELHNETVQDKEQVTAMQNTLIMRTMLRGLLK